MSEDERLVKTVCVMRGRGCGLNAYFKGDEFISWEAMPEDAEKYGISDGDLVEVASLRGRIKIKAAVTDDMIKGVVHVYHGWPGESNVNLITPDKPTDPVSGGSAFRSSLCRVKRLP